jgi:pimeloyl-ACP methyl ester carboxylesterase
VKFDRIMLFGPDDARAVSLDGDDAAEPKEVLLYLPGLDFSGVSGCGALPALSTRYDVWWARVDSSYRGDFAAIADTVAAQVQTLSGGHRKVTLLGESFGGLLALGVALRVRDSNARAAPTAIGGGGPTTFSELRGAVLVNSATAFDQTPWLAFGSLLAKLPSQTLAELPAPLASALKAAGASKLPRVSPFSAAAAAVLAATLPDVSQVVRGASGLLGDLLASGGPEAAAAKAAARAAQAVAALDKLATNLAPEVLTFRLEKWLAAGCAEVNPRLADLGDTQAAAAAAATARGAAGGSAADAAFFAAGLVGGGLPVLVLAGEEDRMLPSAAEGQRLVSILGRRTASGKVLAGVGHAALDDRPDFIKLIDASALGRATRAEDAATASAAGQAAGQAPPTPYDYVSDFVAPNATQLEAARASLQGLRTAVSPVFVSTDAATGRRQFGVRGVPLPKDLSRPVLLVGNHQLLALDLGLLVEEFARTTGSLPRGLAHPATFVAPSDAVPRRGRIARGGGRGAALEVEEATAGPFSPWANLRKARAANGEQRGEQKVDTSVSFNGIGSFQEFGAVPVTPKNFYKMMQQNQFGLLFPGGAREATHGKGEDYALFWPEERAADFVRVAAKFDALIVPFGAVGAAVSFCYTSNRSGWAMGTKGCFQSLLGHRSGVLTPLIVCSSYACVNFHGAISTGLAEHFV